MKLYPNAKINIGLTVGNTRPDGYHNIETVFYPINLHDELEITQSDNDTTFENDGILVDCNSEQNLVMRTYQLMRKQFNIDNVNIRLTKHIPFGAGLGGGSSDAAFTAIGLNELFELNLTKQQIADIVKPIGADCPFFVFNRPMFAQGIGDIFSDVTIDLNGWWIVLLKPDVSVPTAMAYKNVKTETLCCRLKNDISRPITSWKEHINNAFEASVFPQFPAIAKLKTQLYSIGATYASMTGTGAAVYGLFKQQPDTSIFNHELLFSSLIC